MGTIEEASVYLENGFYLALTGFLCKVCRLKFHSINQSNDVLHRF